MNTERNYGGTSLAVLAFCVLFGCDDSTSSSTTSNPATDGFVGLDTTSDASTDAHVAEDGGVVETDTLEDTVGTAEDDSSVLAEDAVEPEDGEISSDASLPDGGEGGESTASVEVFEYTRFPLKQPARIWSVRAMFEVVEPTTVNVYVWDDFGGNFVSLWHEQPLARVTAEVTPAENGQWMTLPLDSPIDLDPGQLVYAGVVVDEGTYLPPKGVVAPEGVEKGETEWLGVHGEESGGVNDYTAWEVPGFPRLHVGLQATDPEGDMPPFSLVWSPNDPPDEMGFVPLSASYDFMISLEVEWIHTVEEFDFESVASEVTGLPGFSRIALDDVNGDGAVDALLGGGGLWINDGSGVFADGTEEWFPAGAPGNGMFGDYDNDGDPDFFENGLQDRLFRNDGGVFVDVTAESGIDDWQGFLCDGNKADQNVPTETSSWIDVNGDGWLDLYQGNFICWGDGLGSQDLLWVNQGDGTFVNGTEAANLVEGQQKEPGQAKYYNLASRGTAPADYDNDGDMDLFVGNYRLHRNLMWDNQGDGAFVNRGEESILEGYGVEQGFITWYGHTIGAAWGDVDHDGDLDVFHANLAHPRFFWFSDLATLYINGGGPNPVFEDVGEAIGIRYQETPSNPNLFDYDNDGDLDLFYTCIYADRPSQFYRNDGHPEWKEVSYSTGVAVLNGWGSVTLDMDQDGDLDLLASTGNYRNRNLSGGGSVFIRPMGSGAGKTNKSGFGARVEATVDGKLLVRELAGSHGTSVQRSPFLHLGLGSQQTVSVEVKFPLSGTVIPLEDLPAGSRLIVHEDGTVETL